jgi:8-oxo-dGTP diphosphatase
MESNHRKPEVGVGVIIIHQNKVLLGKRKGSHGAGAWSFPGGHLEFGESWESCARREVLEETGVHIQNIRFGAVTNDVFTEESKHYVTIFLVADYASGEVTLMEPEKCDRWEWFNWHTLPEPLFVPLMNLRKTTFDPLLIVS